MQYKPLSISTIINPDNLNLAEYMSDEELQYLGSKLKRAFDVDLASRTEWDENMEQWLKLAVQYKETKNFPWPGAANVKYPLITTSAMQFAARAYPNLIIGKKPVKGRVVGKESPELIEAVNKIAEHMSYQLMEENHEWEEEMDRMFVILPILGIAFKKTFYDSVEGRNRSQLILPTDLVVNYWAKSLGGYTRKHHILEMTANDVYTRKEMELFLDVDLPDPRVSNFTDRSRQLETQALVMPSEDDETVPYKFIECHCHWDLDQDGYQEPYIVTFEYSSGQILRIIPRFREDDVVFTNTGKRPKVVRIQPDEYFTKYGFIPNPDGSFYDLGFGLLLGPLNETVNSAINQSLDQGTMYNTGGGFLGKGVRIKAGEYRLAPNEWKVVNTTTDDLRKAIFPNPVKEPSKVSIDLAQMLIEGGNKVASIADIFVGKMPGQNTPATTTMETIKQSSAVFTAIYKRIYRSFDSELKKLFKLNRLYLDEEIDYPVELKRSDYEAVRLTVTPTADPDTATDSEKLAKAQQLLQLLQLGTINPQVVTKRVLEAMRIEGIEELMNYQAPPSPEQQQMQAEQQMAQQEAQMDMQQRQAEEERAERESQRKMAMQEREGQLKAISQQQDIQSKAAMSQIDARSKMVQAAIDARSKMQDATVKARTNEGLSRQKLRQNEEKHQQTLKQMKEKKAATPKKKAAK